MDRPLSYAENEEFLRRLRERRIGLGVDSPKIEVRFEEMSVEANLHMGLRALPTLFNSAVNAVQEFMGFLRLYPTKKRPIKLLDQVKGIIKPSRMTLLLGLPGSGKSTLLRALAGKLDPNLKLKGKVTYNGQEISASTPHRMCAYVSQHDVHHAEMTVRETLDFSRRMFGTGKNFDMPGEGRKNADTNKVDPGIDDLLKGVTNDDMDNFTTNYFIKLLGLQECADINIGDEMRRGISGGQKKRVTIGKAINKGEGELLILSLQAIREEVTLERRKRREERRKKKKKGFKASKLRRVGEDLESFSYDFNPLLRPFEHDVVTTSILLVV